MSNKTLKVGRLVKAVQGLRKIQADPNFEIGLAEYFRRHCSHDAMLELYAKVVMGDGLYEAMMRRVVGRALARKWGNGIQIGSGVYFKHLETFEIGNGVFIGPQSNLQGRSDGKCILGDHVWIGPQSYFDARDLVIEDHVGWGPGARVLGSMHTGLPSDVPIIQTDLRIQPVRIEAWADIGTNAVILPGVTVGKGSIVGAGAVVTKDVPAFAVVAGIPAQFLRWREGKEAQGKLIRA